MGALGWLLVTDQPNLLAWSVGIVAAMLAIEALLRRRLVGLVLRVTLTTAAGIGALWLVRFAGEPAAHRVAAVTRVGT